MRLLALLLLPVLAGCAGREVAADVPAAEHTVTERRVFVPIDAALTGPCPIAPSTALSDAPAVAAARKASLEVCNAKLAAIATVQGTSVNPPKKDEK